MIKTHTCKPPVGDTGEEGCCCFAVTSLKQGVHENTKSLLSIISAEKQENSPGNRKILWTALRDEY